MQHQQHVQQSLSHPASLILASLLHGPKHAVALREAIEQTRGIFIEPGTLYRVLAELERRGWIEALTTEHPLRLYQITALGLLSFERAEASHHGEQFREGEHPDVRTGKEIFMRLILWILRLYPPAWRERYETEMVALLEEHHITLWTMLDLLVGALDARLDPHYRRAGQLLPLRRFQTSWRLVVAAFVAFWIALLPWLWMSALGLSPDDVRCSDWGNYYAFCMMRVTVGMHGPQVAHTLVGMLLGWLPFLLLAFTVTLVLARGRKARTHLLLALPVTIGIIALCMSCGVWLSALWPLFPQISHFYPQTLAALLAGLVGMGLATLFALVALVRAAFALRALSVASPKQESLPFSSDQQEGQPAQSASTLHLEHPTPFASSSRASSVPKGWIVVLAVLLLVFILPWPLLDTANSPPFSIFLGNWFFAGVVGIITALLVTIRSRSRFWRTLQVWGSVAPVVLYILLFMLSIVGRFLFPSFWVYWLLAIWVSIIPAQFVRGRSDTAQADRATEPPRKALSPRMRAIVVLLVWLAFSLPGLLAMVFGHPPIFYGIASLIIFSCIYITPALVVKEYNRNKQVDRPAQKPRNRLPPWVWIMVLPVLFLVFCMQFEFIVIPDYPNLEEVLIAWLTTGLAGLIILLAVKLGSRVSMDLPTQETLQQVQVQG